MATPKVNTSHPPVRDPQDATLTPLPFPIPLALLGQQMRALSELYDQLNDQRSRIPAHEVGRTSRLKLNEALADDREQALRALAFTIPARTMPYAVVHLSLAIDTVEDLLGNMHTEPERDRLLVRVRRVLASVFPLVAEAAGTTANDHLDELFIKLRDREFGIVEGVA